MRLPALVFDAYGTLFDMQSMNASCEALWPGCGDRVSERWRAKQLEYAWLRSLMGRYADFETVTAEALGHTCEVLGLSCGAWQEATLLAAYRNLHPYPEATGVLKLLEGRRRVVLSNGSANMLNAVLRGSGLDTCLDEVLSVDAIRVFKPDRRAYDFATHRLGVDRRQIGFVSSNAWDVCGAASFGFQVFWLNRGGKPMDRLGVTPNHVLPDLAGLLARLT